VRYCASAGDVSSDAAEAYAAAMQAPQGSATLIVPTDTSWSDAPEPSARREVDSPATVSREAVKEAARVLRGKEQAALLVAGNFISAEIAALCSQISKVTGARAYTESFVARTERGAGRATLPRLPYFPEMMIDELKDIRHIILVGTHEPISFFAYPSTPSQVKPAGCALTTLATAGEDTTGALQALADALGAKPEDAVLERARRPELPTSGPLNALAVNTVIGHYLPEGAIVSDEGATSSPDALPLTAGSPPHDYLGLTGGAIGQGLPAALGAAVACPDRKVISIQADGSAMYTVQALWSMAREESDVTVVIYSNRSYAILRVELARAGIPEPSDRIARLVDLDRPDLDFVSMARGLGIEADRAASVSEFTKLFAAAMDQKGPRLIEAVLDPPGAATP
jgi:acetolactate synthase-1/2/3 large subunit